MIFYIFSMLLVFHIDLCRKKHINNNEQWMKLLEKSNQPKEPTNRAENTVLREG